MLVVNRIKLAISRLIIRIGRERLRNQLLSLSDRMLLDAGFSPELVKAGTHAWPWQLERDMNVQPSLGKLASAQVGVIAPQQSTAKTAQHAHAA